MFYVVKVNQFQGSPASPARPDKNGRMPVVLTCYNGVLPNNARVISGTVAERAGLHVGENFVVQLNLVGTTREYGEQYRYDVVGYISPLEIATKIQEFPTPRINNLVEAATPVRQKVTSEDED